MNLEPGSKYIIPYQLSDPTDAATYYCRAYIRKAIGDDLIATVTLEDKGEGRFSGEWYVPQYNVPTQVIITTKIFTDSDYTTESNLYWRVNESHMIQQSWSPVFGSGGGGGSSINYKKIEEILRKIIKDEIRYEKAEKIDWNPVFSEIRAVIKAVEDKKMPEFPKIEFPKQEKVDLGPVLDELRYIKNLAGALKNSDLSPIIAYLHDIEKVLINKAGVLEVKKILDEKAEAAIKFPRKRRFNLPFEVKERPEKRAFAI